MSRISNIIYRKSFLRFSIIKQSKKSTNTQQELFFHPVHLIFVLGLYFSKYKLDFMSIASFIDHTILKPTTTSGDIKKLCSEATAYGFAAVCVPPYFVEEAVTRIQNSDVKVATVIGFPFGYHHYTAKIAEVKQAIKDKVNEVDMVMNLCAFKEKNEDYLRKEIS